MFRVRLILLSCTLMAKISYHVIRQGRQISILEILFHTSMQPAMTKGKRLVKVHGLWKLLFLSHFSVVYQYVDLLHFFLFFLCFFPFYGYPMGYSWRILNREFSGMVVILGLVTYLLEKIG